MNEKPVVSVICLTFNHAKYIRECLDGFTMQKTDFPFEVIIHDDASTDETAEIIREYENARPDIFKPIYQSANQFTQGVDVVKQFILPRIRGTYVAWCEGDDYWTDPLKLQKQIDFLRANPDYAVCFHPVKVHWEDGREDDTIFPTPEMRFNRSDFSLQDILKRNFIQTNSAVYRWRFHTDSPDLIPDFILPGDWYLHLLHAETGKIRCMDDVMAVYRRNEGGLWTGADKSPQWFRKCGEPYIEFLKHKQEYFKTDEQKEILSILAQLLLTCEKSEDRRSVMRRYPRETNRLLTGVKNCRLRLIQAKIMKLVMPKRMKATLKKEIRFYRSILKLREIM